ncbi:MAG: ABC transporter permease [Saprospiraceae bacterium]|nr:ABC transporter permease [Saprospiraceae bacterium]MCF8248685.1 ABC transporter permease [Saprospiraceae bacterium]MCF8278825.1 ABC transporter permease [Bacteroidales bacterium]MCF8310625.1 ABC transporter permease [Saprospiraceae bacterium]MCF8439184.1 ABC transporter permease [Saprospiraceae bacterium]
MRRLLFIIQKEFIQIIRNKAILPMMTVLPIVQLILLSYAANNEVKNVNIVLIDQDHSSYSRLLVSKVQVSDHFTIVAAVPSHKQGDDLLQGGEADVVLTIPPNFERDFIKQKGAGIQVLVNAINGQQATVGAGYLGNILQSFNQEIGLDAMPKLASQRTQPPPTISITYSNWYNPELNYKYFMTPGILGELVTILIMVLTAMNVVREREIGTIEQINVTPIRKWQFILGKMIPFLFVGLLLLTVGLTAGKLLFDIPIEGSLWVVFAYCLLNLSAVLGMGLLISNMVDTQQQAMFVAFFFVLIFILMSGLFTPIESMPKWAQYLAVPNPVAHFVDVMRKVLLKGSGFADVAYQFRVTAVMAVVFNVLAVVSYRKQE